MLARMTGGLCRIALSPVPGVKEVSSIQAVASYSGENIGEMGFEASEAAGPEMARYFNGLTGQANTESGWQGFTAAVDESVEGGRKNSFVLRVTLEDGVGPRALIEALGQHGILGTGSAHPDGSLGHDHESVRYLGSGEIILLPPSNRAPGLEALPAR